MTKVSRVVCNMCLFLFVLHRAEDMVSTNAYFLARHEGILQTVTVFKGVQGFDCCHVSCWHGGNLHGGVV